MNVVWKKYKHKQSGDGCRWNVYAECGLFTFARGDYLVRFVSANHVDWRFQGLKSLPHPMLQRCLSSLIERKNVLEVRLIL